MKKNTVAIFFILFTIAVHASSVDTVEIYSKAMHRAFKCVVIKPEKYKKEGLHFATVYILHGYAGWYSNWIIRVPQLNEYADKYNMILVCPEGGYASWYFDSPIDSTSQFETYISKEVPNYIDDHYRTIPDRKARAITGLSMGGHGALFIAFRHSDMFSACGSISGVVDFKNSKSKFEIAGKLGDTINYAKSWIDHSVINVVEKKPADTIAIMIDCGINDIVIAENRALHSKLIQLKIPHDYVERTGQHDWAYWRGGIEYQLLFFKRHLIITNY